MASQCCKNKFIITLEVSVITTVIGLIFLYLIIYILLQSAMNSRRYEFKFDFLTYIF